MCIQELDYRMNRPSKRRQETALRIQAAAIRLALQDGMANPTAEAITREAGVSPRTFFNYYPYKEAVIAAPQGLPTRGAGGLCRWQAALIGEDLG